MSREEVLPKPWLELLARIERDGERMPRGRGMATTARALVRRGLVQACVPHLAVFLRLGLRTRAAEYTITEAGRAQLAAAREAGHVA